MVSPFAIDGRMTDEGHKLFNDNIKLAKFFSKKVKCPMGFDDEDWYQEVLSCLVQTILYYDPEKGKLSTLMFRLVLHKRSWVINQAKKHSHVSLNHISEKSDVPVCDMVEDTKAKDPSFNIENKDSIENLVSRLSGKRKTICEGILQGKTLQQIGKGLGITREAVRQSIKRMGEEYATDELISQIGLCMDCGCEYSCKISMLNRNRNLRCRECKARNKYLRNKLFRWQNKLQQEQSNV